MLGDPGSWLIRFRDTDTRFLASIRAVWERCLTCLSAQPLEDDISASLVYHLNLDPEFRKIGYTDFQYVPFELQPTGGVKRKGYIDVALILDQDRECYVAYECKRLNVRRNGTRESLAGAYVEEGMMRYVTEQYAQYLPIGCMLGYVIDGDKAFARKQVDIAIKKRATNLRLLKGPTAVAPVAFIERFTTDHTRSNGSSQIEIRHAFLPLTVGGSA